MMKTVSYLTLLQSHIGQLTKFLLMELPMYTTKTYPRQHQGSITISFSGQMT